jgi:formylglycine-generating enzyme required for sulfatase activity
MLRNLAALWIGFFVAACTAQQSQVVLQPGYVKLNPKDGQEYAWKPAGTFMTSSPCTEPECRQTSLPRSVTIAHGFWMGRTEITVGAYKQFVADTGESMPPESEWSPGFMNKRLPIVRLTWDEAGYFCAWAGGRVPSESEWEYAARSGSGSETETDTDRDKVAWHAGNSGGKGPLAVGQTQANAWGLFDILGNVWEWTTGSFPLTGTNDGPNVPPHPDRPFYAIRGGGWGDPPRLIRVSVRGRAEAGHRSNSIGARCILPRLN